MTRSITSRRRRLVGEADHAALDLTPKGDDLREALDAVRAVLADHERRLFPVNRRGLPEPTSRIEKGYIGMVGDVWDVRPDKTELRGWRVICLDADRDGSEVVYVHTPHSMVDPGEDVVSMRPGEARLLAASILAAVDRVESRSGRVVVQLREGQSGV